MFSHCLGTKLVWPCSTAASAGPARGFMRTNHCLEIIGSTMAPERWERPTRMVWAFVPRSRPSSASFALMFSRASKRSWPA